MADGMDYYDVQAMVEKAVSAEKWSRNRHIEDVEKDLRREFRREVMELREEVGEAVIEVTAALTRERADRIEDVRSLARAFNDRTGHLA
jgi:F0F1-type ATP synthase membrane subunit b/b'